MSIIEFEHLSESEKIDALNAYGTFIAERRLRVDRIYLYALGYFYVELFHELSSLNNTGVTVYRVFDTDAYLDVYLKKIDISDLTEAN